MELKHFIDTQDFSKEELLNLIELIRKIKKADKEGATPKLLEGGLPDEAFEVIEGDVRDSDTCRAALKGVEVVFHEAALGSVPRSIEDPPTTHDVNITGTLNMLVAARDARVKRFVFASSSSVYGDAERYPTAEDALPRPFSPYGV